MADKSINQLPVSFGLSDDGLMVVYQNGATKSITGSLIKAFAQQGVESALAAAKESGEFDGQDGTNGKDGVSPTITVTDITGGHRLTITDVNGTKTVDVMDGKDGEGGSGGGTDGKDGEDGFSPIITVTEIDGGHRLTITDVNGTQTVDIMDGVDGTGGTGDGDMKKSVYDPQGKEQDVFDYVDKKLDLLDSLESRAFVVTVHTDTNKADTSIDLIFDALNIDEKAIYAKIEYDDGAKYQLFPLVSLRGNGFANGVSYAAQAKFAAVIEPDDSAPFARVITLTEGDDPVYPDVSICDYSLSMPTVTAADDGKILQVVGGQWAAVAITDGNNVAY